VLLAYSSVFTRVFAVPDLHAAGPPGFRGNEGYVQYLVGAPIVMSAMLATASAGIGVAVERQLGFYDRMTLSPLGPSVSQLARRLVDGTRISLFVVVLTFVALLAGAHVASWPLALGVTVPLAASLGIAYGGLSFALCLRSGSAEPAQAVTPLFLPLLFLSTAFVPLPLVPQSFHFVVQANPLSAVCDTIRLAYAGELDWPSLARSALAIALLALATQLLILRTERRLRGR
jgi:ABC-2 type transport system permease protein